MLRFVICLFMLLLSAHSWAYSNVIVFGDSLSDAASFLPTLHAYQNQGNNTWLDTQGNIGAPITNTNPATAKAEMWPNYLVQSLFSNTQQPSIIPNTQMYRIGANPKENNINYAFAGAETGPHYMNDRLGLPYLTDNHEACVSHGPGLISSKSTCIPGLRMQVELYLQDVNEQPNPNSLFILWAGSNDVVDNISKILTKQHGKPNALFLLGLVNAIAPMMQVGQVPLEDPVNNIYAAVSRLINAGIPAGQIFVISLPDLDVTPLAHQFTENRALLTIFYDLTEMFNALLAEHLKLLLPKGHFIELAPLIAELRQNMSSHGFTTLSDSCVTDQKTPYCKGYAFFNDKHPTSQMHKMVAKTIETAVIAP